QVIFERYAARCPPCAWACAPAPARAALPARRAHAARAPDPARATHTPTPARRCARSPCTPPSPHALGLTAPTAPARRAHPHPRACAAPVRAGRAQRTRAGAGVGTPSSGTAHAGAGAASGRARSGRGGCPPCTWAARCPPPACARQTGPRARMPMRTLSAVRVCWCARCTPCTCACCLLFAACMCALRVHRSTIMAVIN
ncbi:hypothetical protein GGX14DRAFT_672860, partial [Mycena pura]